MARPRLLTLLALAVALLLGAGACLVWRGRIQDARDAWEARLAGLRSRGEPVTLADLGRRASDPEASNGAPLLESLHRTHGDLVAQLTNGGFLDGGRSLDEAVSWWQAHQEELDEAFATLRRVAASEVVVATGPLALGEASSLWSGLSDAACLWRYRIRTLPPQAQEGVCAMLETAAAIRPRTVLDGLVGHWLLFQGLDALREALASAAVDPRRATRLGDALVAVEGRVIPNYHDMLRAARAEVVAWVDLCTSDRRVPPDLDVEADRSPFARIRVYREAEALLGGVDETLSSITDPPGLRTAGFPADPLPDHPAARSQGIARQNALHALAAVRLARVALRVHARLRDGKGLPTTLADLDNDVGGALPVDPYTGEAFLWGLRADGAFLQADPVRVAVELRPADWSTRAGAVRDEEMLDLMLGWRFVRPPAGLAPR